MAIIRSNVIKGISNQTGVITCSGEFISVKSETVATNSGVNAEILRAKTGSNGSIYKAKQQVSDHKVRCIFIREGSVKNPGLNLFQVETEVNKITEGKIAWRPAQGACILTIWYNSRIIGRALNKYGFLRGKKSALERTTQLSTERKEWLKEKGRGDSFQEIIVWTPEKGFCINPGFSILSEISTTTELAEP